MGFTKSGLNTDTISTGDFLVLRFGNGTQGVKVVGTTAKRLEIVRCQGYQSDDPFWLGHVSKVSRTDSRILTVWAVPAQLAASAPTPADVAETKDVAKARAACSKVCNAAAEALEPWDGWTLGVHVTEGMTDAEADAWRSRRDARRREATDAWDAALVEWSREHGRDRFGKRLAS